MTTALIVSVVLQGTISPIFVDGEGYLRFLVDGKVAFRREASLTIREGVLTDEQGNPVVPRLEVGQGTEGLSVDLEGNVTGSSGSGKRPLGRLVLTIFSGEQPQSNGIYAIARGRGSLADPGSTTAGVIRMGRRGQTPSNRAVKASSSAERTAMPTIRIREASSVDGPQILLGDVAELEGVGTHGDALAAVSLGDSPPLGVERSLDRIRIEGRLRMAGFDPKKYSVLVPSSARVVRKGNAIEHQQFVDKALAALQAQSSPNLIWKASTVLGPMAIPAGKSELVVESVSATRQTASVKVAVFVDSKRFNSRTLTFTGTSSVTTVPSGATVTVRVRSNAAAIEVTGKLKSAAAIGDAVGVQAIYGGQAVTLTGTLLSPSLVEVRL